MFDALLKSKFYCKCKYCIKLTKTRIEIIKRKRNAMQKYWRKDIADLLMNGFDSNAYGRVDGLYIEQNQSWCYEFVEQSCSLISSHLSTMNKQRKCPEECREAVSSLMFAAARFADLPELRGFRSLFTERYGDFHEPYVNKEFVKKLKTDPPAKDMKLQIMQEIALESGIEWDSKALEQKLYKPTQPAQDRFQDAKEDRRNNEPSKNRLQYGMETNIQETVSRHSNNRKEVQKQKDEDHLRRNALSYNSKAEIEKKTEENHRNERVLPYRPRNTTVSNGITSSPKSSTGPDDVVSGVVVEERKFFGFRSMAPPYVKTDTVKKGTNSDTSLSSFGTEEEIPGTKPNPDNHQQHQEESLKQTKPVPRSVRQRPMKPPPGSQEVSKPSPKLSNGEVHDHDHDHRDEEERTMDKLLVHYSRKPSQAPPTSDSWTINRSGTGGGGGAPTRVGSLPSQLSPNPATIGARKGHARAASFQSDSTASLSHVHPKLPDYDEFVARLAAFRASS